MKVIILMGLFCLVSGLARAQNINKAEYFLDSDPGVGLATPVTVSSPSDSVNVNFTVPLSFAKKGFHKLFVRTRNVNGKWSLNETRAIYVTDNGTIVLPGNVLSYEYFIDNDPGLGKGTKGHISDTSNIHFTIPATGLIQGFHKIGLRLFDSNDLWSLNETRIIYILPDTGVKINGPIVEGEYFIDHDPGLGKGTNIPGISSSDSVAVDLSTSLPVLNAGFHKFLIRFKNSLGQWGLPDCRIFYIDENKQFNSGPIVEAEYYFDNDPGLGMATQVTPLDTADSISFNLSIAASSLSVGNHKMVVRVKDSINQWSQPEIKNFSISDTVSTALSFVSGGENKFLLFPNPASDVLHIYLNLTVATSASIELFDYTGRSVQLLHFENLKAGDNQLMLNTSQLNHGIYMLHLQTSGGILVTSHFIKK